MSAAEPQPTPALLGLFLAACALTAVAAVVVGMRRAPEGESGMAAPLPVARVVPPSEPIRAEAQLFRSPASMLAIAPATHRERSAHPRRLSTVRFIRAYPGAPPRIPHGVTAEEFRTDACRTCHARGGYSLRFAAYVPVTPHPERGICTQCHLGVDSVVGTTAADADPNSRCPLCHGPAGTTRRDAAITWASTVWPEVLAGRRDRPPPAIPHDLQFRENCLTCHTGPAAVDELRTTHPERSNCRQCHLMVEPTVDSAP